MKVFQFCIVAACVSACSTHATAATIVAGDVTANLGPDFFLDAAATGGNDFFVNQPNTALFGRTFSGLNVGPGGSQVSISGVGWASANNATASDATSAQVTITYLGADGVFGGGDDVAFGSVTDNYTFSGAGEYYWRFDTPLEAVIDGLNSIFRVAVAPLNDTTTGSLTMKTTTGTTAGNVKLSVAGTSVALSGQIPEPSSLLIAAALVCGGTVMARRRRA